MTFNFNNLLQLIKNNKFIIILVAFILLILILNTKPIIEGLTSIIGEYDYLAPVPSDNTFSDDIFRQFVDKYNEITCPPGSTTGCVPIDISSPDNFYNQKTHFEILITEPEATYYIQNGKFPYDGYVMNSLKKQPNYTEDGADQAMKTYPNRALYEVAIKPTDATMNPPPLAYNIYMGTAKPPTIETHSTT
jgi:hypothetical protein